MKKMHLHIYIAMGIFIAMFIVGSFLDLQISQAVFVENHGFGLSVAALSMNFGYAVIALMGGVIFYHALKLTKIVWQKIFFILLAIVFYGVAVYFDAKEFFGKNGWYNPEIVFGGYLLAAPIMFAASFGGFVLGKKANNPRLWILMVIGAAFIGLSLIVGTTIVKNIFHRPRFREAVYYGYCDFYPWWQRCVDYKSIMQMHGLAKEEFKSFPSGHTSVCAMTMFGVVLIPFITGKELKYQVVYFYLALVFTLAVAFTRILVGAHFLSDVGMGGLITLICLYIYYEIILHNPKIYEKPTEQIVE